MTSVPSSRIHFDELARNDFTVSGYLVAGQVGLRMTTFAVDSSGTRFVPIGTQTKLRIMLKVCVPITSFCIKKEATIMGVYLTLWKT